MALSSFGGEQAQADLLAWRRDTRRRLLAARSAMSKEEHEQGSARIRGELRTHVDRWRSARRGSVAVGAYYPIRGEPDLVPLLAELCAEGICVALPVAAGGEMPLHFRTWRPGEGLARAAGGVYEPYQGRLVQPEFLLVPTLGFDAGHFRLGYGGGFYDRTLRGASCTALGVGFSLGRLPTIYPQSWDVPLSGVITEASSHG